jgi:hypothetical protein
LAYWELVTRSFRLAWNHKYLWLIALFSGEASTGGNYSYNYQRPSSATGAPDLASIQQQFTTWIGDHAGLVVSLIIIWILLAVALFILAAICEGATIRAAAEHDAERPFGLRLAWRMGVHTMWVIVRYRLILLALGLPLAILVIGFLAATFVAIRDGNSGAAPWLVLYAIGLFVVGIPYAIYLFFLDRLGSRAVILEELMAAPGIARANRLLFKRFGRTLLIWILSIGVSTVIGIALACLGAIVIAPFAVLALVIANTSTAAAWSLILLGVLILLPLSLLVAGFFAAQGSTYWTLAFRRLDLDYAPAAAYPAFPPPAPPVTGP